MKPCLWLRSVMAILAVAAAAFAASATPVDPKVQETVAPRTGHQHVPGGGMLRWCLADDPTMFGACMKMCHAGEVDVVVVQGSRFGLPVFNPQRCSVLEQIEGEGA